VVTVGKDVLLVERRLAAEPDRFWALRGPVVMPRHPEYVAPRKPFRRSRRRPPELFRPHSREDVSPAEPVALIGGIAMGSTLGPIEGCAGSPSPGAPEQRASSAGEAA